MDYLLRIKNSLSSRKKTYKERLWQFYKKYRTKYKKIGQPETYIWILGCQRSGTTLLERIYRSDLDSAVFGEFSELTIDPGRTVWKTLPEVDKILVACNARYIVARPLFESDRAQEILDTFPKSKVVWLFRTHTHVVNSMINKWGDSFFEISCKNETDNNGFWRMESLVEEINQELGSNPSVADQYALYWLKRNEILFTDNLNQNSRVLCLSYEKLVTSTRYCIDMIMKESGEIGVWRRFKTDAHTNSLKNKLEVDISPELSKRCDDMYARMSELSTQHFRDA